MGIDKSDMNYTDKNGAEIKAGDICFYSEDDGTNKFSYANAIERIVDVDGKLMSSCMFYTSDGGFTFRNGDDELGYIDLYWAVKGRFPGLPQAMNDAKEPILHHFTKIGTIADKELFDIDFVNENYARKKVAKRKEATHE